MSAPAQTPGFDVRVEQFVKLRDKIKEIEERHKEELLPYRDAKEKLESLLLQHLVGVGADSVKTSCGTVYKTSRKSAGLADKAAFWTFVEAQKKWDLIDYKANAPAVEEYLKNNSALPPGVNYNETFTVGVRRK